MKILEGLAKLGDRVWTRNQAKEAEEAEVKEQESESMTSETPKSKPSEEQINEIGDQLKNQNQSTPQRPGNTVSQTQSKDKPVKDESKKEDPPKDKPVKDESKKEDPPKDEPQKKEPVDAPCAKAPCWFYEAKDRWICLEHNDSKVIKGFIEQLGKDGDKYVDDFVRAEAISVGLSIRKGAEFCTFNEEDLETLSRDGRPIQAATEKLPSGVSLQLCNQTISKPGEPVIVTRATKRLALILDDKKWVLADDIDAESRKEFILAALKKLAPRQKFAYAKIYTVNGVIRHVEFEESTPVSPAGKK
ncbi:MAG: hypothetical protein Q4A33_02905 [Candidatus Saccharibacteria bacterium]|nr:hypothetical protein [Candidatus Saccharibacteria bacterium]